MGDERFTGAVHRGGVMMLCKTLKSLSSDQLLNWAEVIDRIELETPQVIYMLHCRACGEEHSIDFSLMTGEPAAFLSAAAMLATGESPSQQHFQSAY
jgi:hypothetical protein